MIKLETLPGVDTLRELTPAELDDVTGGDFSVVNFQTNSFSNHQTNSFFNLVIGPETVQFSA